MLLGVPEPMDPELYKCRKTFCLGRDRFKILVFALNGYLPYELVKGQTVWPEALAQSKNRSGPKVSFSFVWRIDRQSDQIKFQRELLPLRTFRKHFDVAEFEREMPLDLVRTERSNVFVRSKSLNPF